jgi:hypothetical protein
MGEHRARPLPHRLSGTDPDGIERLPPALRAVAVQNRRRLSFGACRYSERVILSVCLVAPGRSTMATPLGSDQV